MNYTHCFENGRLGVALHGEIDHHGAKEVRNGIDGLISEYSPEYLILDLSDIVFCDSSGLGLLMGRYKKMKEMGGRMYIYEPSDAVKRILYLSGLDKLIKIYEK